MANYAELDSNNVVINLWKVGNEYQDMGPPVVIDSGARWIYDWLFHHEQADRHGNLIPQIHESLLFGHKLGITVAQSVDGAVEGCQPVTLSPDGGCL